MPGIAQLIRHYRRRLTTKLAFDIRTTINGRTLRIPIVESIGWDNVDPRPRRLDTIFKQILASRRGAFIDVGVNIGQTLLKVVSIDPARSYLGFEVSPFCSSYVDRLIALNGLDRCTLIPLGLSDRLQSASFACSSPADTQGTTIASFWPDELGKNIRRTVLLQPGDAILPELLDGEIAMIKIDVEGGELEVLRGLRQTLKQFEPPIILEILPALTEPGEPSTSARAAAELRKQRMAALVQLLADLSYLPFRIAPDSLDPVRDFDLPTYDEDLCDYILLPAHRLAEYDDLLGNALVPGKMAAIAA